MYYFVVFGIGIVGILTFTSAGVWVVNFFKTVTPSVPAVNIIIPTLPLNKLIDSKEIQELVKKALEETKVEDVVDLSSQFFFENFDKISTIIDSVHSFLLNHLQ